MSAGAEGRLVIASVPEFKNCSTDSFTSSTVGSSRRLFEPLAPWDGRMGIHPGSRLLKMLLGPRFICASYSEACWETEGDTLGDIKLF